MCSKVGVTCSKVDFFRYTGYVSVLSSKVDVCNKMGVSSNEKSHICTLQSITKYGCLVCRVVIDGAQSCTALASYMWSTFTVAIPGSILWSETKLKFLLVGSPDEWAACQPGATFTALMCVWHAVLQMLLCMMHRPPHWKAQHHPKCGLFCEDWVRSILVL